MSEQFKEETKTVETEENLFKQEDVNNIVAKNVKEERAKLLKELGIEDVNNAKQALAEYSKMQESQKTELEKLQESSKEKDSKITELTSQLMGIKNEQRLSSALTEMEIDAGYSKAIYKLLDKDKISEDDKEFKSLIEETINTYLPDAKKVKKVGAEKVDKKALPGGTKEFLNTKYKGNPFYKG